MISLLFSIFLACTSSEAPTHTVVRGDTLSKLAQSYNCSVSDLRTWNNIEGDLIEVGQILVVGVAENKKNGAAKKKAPRKSSGPRLPHRVINVGDIKSPHGLPLKQKKHKSRPAMPKPKACMVLKDAQLSDQQMMASPE